MNGEGFAFFRWWQLAGMHQAHSGWTEAWQIGDANVLRCSLCHKQWKTLQYCSKDAEMARQCA